ncbi:MAG: N-acetyl-gamma-glutamyl-phosphate reductase, partial [Spirochaetales bacterium]|nr:N-acetyl-gamma-glutamyl-phosphate reductase [Spirochaetales bacterium]
MKKVFIDGSAGTTGLRIYERLSQRKDIELVSLPDEIRKDFNARKDIINSSDIVFLCLPDDAARESVSMVENPDVCIIDTSTAHRTADGWTYGFPEIGGRYEKIAFSRRVANPGCHASGFISLVAPLVELGILKKDAALTCFSLTGYSGGGKKMIAQYQEPGRNVLLDAPRQYGLTQKHKHLPEMAVVSGIDRDPVFCPIVAPYYAGMQVTVPVFADMVNTDPAGIAAAYEDYYKGPVVKYCGSADDGGFLSAGLFSGKDGMAISVSSGTVTITGNGTIDAGDDIALDVAGGTVTIVNGSFSVVGVDDGSLT